MTGVHTGWNGRGVPMTPAARELVLIRHGESTANVAREQAEDAHAEVIEVSGRDADVPLSELGQAQAAAVGRWLAGYQTEGASVTVWSSPYARARTTAQLAMRAAGCSDALRIDERLRDKELGILDTLTMYGVQTRYPQEWERRRWLGKFYYRAPGGESWADMTLRVRSFLADIRGPGRRVVFTHDAMVMLIRYVCEELDEQTLLDLARANPIGNASVTRLVSAEDGPWRVVQFNDQSHLVGPDGSDLRTEHSADVDVHPR